MPKKAQLTTKEKEKYFVNLYLKQGADDANVPRCEKRAGLKTGTGTKILARKSVKKQIAVQVATIQAEQLRQHTIGEAIDQATKVYQEQLARKVELIKCHKIEMPVLLGRLMQGVLGIDMNTWPKELLEYIKTAMVIEGAIQAGNTKRLTPGDDAKENPAAGVYTAVFDRLRSQSSSGTPSSAPLSETEANAQDGASDLYPGLPTPAIATVTGMPLPGESIDETPVPKPSDPNVITIEVG